MAGSINISRILSTIVKKLLNYPLLVLVETATLTKAKRGCGFVTALTVMISFCMIVFKVENRK